MTAENTFTIQKIATISTPFNQKFGIPRQPNLSVAKGIITFEDTFDDANMLKGIDSYSHLWLLFVFHQTIDRGWKSTVKAPRLGGNSTMGVFASRSTHRPNAIGMSVVKNKGLHPINGKKKLMVEGVDLVNGTPLVDIKPYLHYADSVDSATDSLNQLRPIPQREVIFENNVKPQLTEISRRHSDFTQLVCEVLAQDPRPAYKQPLDNDDKTYKVSLYNFDISFIVKEGIVVVTQIVAL